MMHLLAITTLACCLSWCRADRTPTAAQLLYQQREVSVLQAMSIYTIVAKSLR